MALKTRHDFYNLHTGINTRLLVPTSRKLVNGDRHAGAAQQSNCRPERLCPRSRHSPGWHAQEPQHVRDHEAGGRRHPAAPISCSASTAAGTRSDSASPTWAIKSTTPSCRHVFEAFKVLADRKKLIYDADIEALVENQLHSGTMEVWTLVNFSCSASFGVPPTAAVNLRHQDGRIVCEPAVGDGPVDAVLKSIQRGTGIDLKVTDYRVRSVTGGLDAQGEAVVEVEFDNRKLSGRGVNTNVIEASAQAFLQVINRIALRQVRPRLKPTDHVPQEVVPAA